MFGVVANHLLVQGGALYVENTFWQNTIVWLVEIISYVAVDCYIIVSGYVNYKEEYKKKKYSRIIDLWFQVVFWGIIVNLIANFFVPITISDWIHSLFPITFQQYWFFTTYFALFFVMPVLNQLCFSMGKESMYKVLVVCILLFSVYATLISPLGDYFYVGRGFSFLWFCILYIIGALLKKYKIVKEISWAYIGLVAGILITWFFVCFFGKITEYFVGSSIGESIFVSYNSPTILIASISCVVIFSNIQIKFLKKSVHFFSSVTFCVYIIHMHPAIKENLIRNNFEFIGKIHSIFIPIVVITMSMCITLFCMLADKCREYIFKKVRIQKVENAISNGGEMIIRKLLKNL